MSGGQSAAFVPGYEYDVFISYAWVNNYPQQDDKPESGWVTQFKTKLQQRVDERLGRVGATRMFFDTVRLGKNQDFQPQIKAAVQKSALFVALFSDGYLQSPACREEIAHFNQTVGGALAQSGRCFLVRIDPVSTDTYPNEFHGYLENLLGYEFFATDPVSQKAMRVQAHEKSYQIQLEALRSDLSDKLKQLRDAPGCQQSQTNTLSTAVATEPRATVLVAQSTADLRKPRKQLITYCESAELNVLGVAPYPSAADQFRASFLADLSQAHIFVQLLSDCYSDRADDFREGKEMWQLAEARQAGVSILQWRDANLDLDEIDDQQHRELVLHPNVRTDPPAAFHKDVVERARRAFDVGKPPPAVGQSRLALVKFSESDQQPTLRMIDALKQANVVCRPTRNGRPMVDRLREIPFDALIVVLGNCPEDWLEARGDELLSVELNFKDQAPLRAYYYCQTNPMIPPFVGRDVLEIRGPEQLDVLVKAIQAAGGGQ